jgi:predicted lipoprotein
VILTLLLSCSRDGTDTASAPPDRTEALSRLAGDFARTNYTEFALRAAELSDAAAVLCADPSSESLTAAREAWWIARAPWKRNEIIQFGPVVEYPERLGPKLDDWPVSADAVEALIIGDTVLDFTLMGTATRGLPVVEYLLWGREEETLPALRETPRRCAVLAGAAADVHSNAVLLSSAWQEDWMDALITPTDGGPYRTQQAVLDEWVNRMAFSVENLRATRLGKPLGDRSGGEVQPDTIESRPSGRSLTDAADILVGVDGVWTLGVRGLVDDDLAAGVDALLATSAARLAAIPEPLEETIVLEPEVVVYTQDALQALQVALQVDLAQTLSVTITFNDNDGD